MPDLHHLNILVHISTASLALAGGVVLLSRPKGTAWHRSLGRIVIGFATLTVVAAWIGALLFRGKVDLIGVTLIVSYLLWSGLRALRLKDNGRRLEDIVPAAMMLLATAGLLYLCGNGGAFNWEPARIYATAGGLAFYGGWDVLRTVFPPRWRVWLNPAEHAFRMTSLTGALLSVAFGTLLKGQAVYASLGASLAFLLLALLFSAGAALRAARHCDGVMPSASRKARLKTDSEL